MSKAQYTLAVMEYQEKINEKKLVIQNLLKNHPSKPKTVNDYYTSIAISLAYVSIMEIYFQQSELYKEIHGKYHEATLDKIRKTFSACVNSVSQTFGRSIPASLSQNSERLAKLTKLSPKRIHNFLIKIDLLWDKLHKSYGMSSRYVSTIVNAYGELTCVALNMVDFRTYIQQSKDLSNPLANDMKESLDFVKTMLEKAVYSAISATNMSGSQNYLQDALTVAEFQISLLRILKASATEIAEQERRKQSIERMLSTES